MEGRIQFVEFFGTDAGDLGCDLEAHLAFGRDAGEVGLVRNRAEREAKGFRIEHQLLHGQELRHVRARLGRQPQVPELHRAPGGAVRVHGPRHERLTAVVGADGEQPVAVELVMERLQVIERCARRFDDVAPPVVPPVLLQPVFRAGVGNELPQARGACARVRIGLEGAFHHRQQRDLERHAAAFQFGDDLVQVQIGAPEGALQILGVRRVPAQLLPDGFLFALVFQAESGAHAVEEVGVLRRRQARDLGGTGRRARRGRIGAGWRGGSGVGGGYGRRGTWQGLSGGRCHGRGRGRARRHRPRAQAAVQQLRLAGLRAGGRVRAAGQA